MLEITSVKQASHSHGLLGHLCSTKPVLLLEVTPVLTMTSQNVCCENMKRNVKIDETE